MLPAVWISLALRSRFECGVGMKKATETTPDVQAQCAALSKALAEVYFYEEGDYVRGGERCSYQDAANWLELAAGVCRVEVLTARFDDCLMYCGTVMDYEDARSELMSMIATQLAIFQFAWGAFETVAKIADPPVIPVNLRFQGKNGTVDRIIYLLKEVTPAAAYLETVEQLKRELPPKNPFPGFGKTAVPAYMGLSGFGINLVRRVRNKFAHGASRFPEPANTKDGWSGTKSPWPNFIALNTRLVLFTIQMLLDHGKVLQTPSPK